jgi:hypothetical protein
LNEASDVLKSNAPLISVDKEAPNQYAPSFMPSVHTPSKDAFEAFQAPDHAMKNQIQPVKLTKESSHRKSKENNVTEGK